MPHFHTTRRVEFHDTDLAGIIHFSNYFLYMEQAEHELFRSLGLKIHGHFPDGTVYGWPRVSTTASFSAPAYYDDLLDVRLTLLRRGPRSLTVRYEFWRGDTQLAVGEMKTAFCRVQQNGRIESLDLPPEIAEPLDRLLQTE
jgi:acyl-CoA thioester hydrolase